MGFGDSAASSVRSLPRLQPISGLPEIGPFINWPKSETSDFGWRVGVGEGTARIFQHAPTLSLPRKRGRGRKIRASGIHGQQTAHHAPEKRTLWSGGSDIISLPRFVLRLRGLCYRAGIGAMRRANRAAQDGWSTRGSDGWQP
jgi:hypothetical protein